MTAVEPEPLRGHYVVIDGRRYPPKQVLAVVTALDRADFTTHQARRTLRRLGFTVARRSPGTSRANPPDHAAAETAGEANRLRPYVGRWVAVSDEEVLFSADEPTAVVRWLQRHDRQADGVFRVPTADDDVETARWR